MVREDAVAKINSRLSHKRFLSSVLMLFALLEVFSLMAQPVQAQDPIFTDPDFVAEIVTTLPPFTPVGLAFAPDGRIFIWQKSGVVRVFKDDALLSTPFIDIRSQVNQCEDRGLLGVALDPNFATNGYVYLLHTLEQGGNPNNCGTKTSRLIRVTANPANPDVALAGSQVVILADLPSDGTSHSIGTVRFAPDGKMFVSSGDGASFNFVDPLALRAQDLNSYAGKILRINPDGSAPGDNPFDDGTNSIRSKVWAYGLRNPFRFGLHPVTGEPYIGDVGWNAWEEVNRGRGANFGWPCYEGHGPHPQYQAAFVQCQQLPSSAVNAPLYTYSHAEGSTAIGGTFYSALRYPQQYHGNFFFADYTAQWIRRMVFDAIGNVSVETFATDVDGPVALELGPDGLLYYIALNSGEVGRIRLIGDTGGPIAQASATPLSGYSPLHVSFSSAGSVDTDGGPLVYFWDFGDGTTSTEPNPQHIYVTSGVEIFTATLTVTDLEDTSDSATVPITVGSVPPVATVLTPTSGTSIDVGDTVAYQGTATDVDDGDLPPSSLSWTLLLHHNDHVHPFVTNTGAGGSFEVVDHGVGNFSYEILLTATDSSDLTDTVKVLLPVNAPIQPLTHLDFTYASRDELLLAGWDFTAKNSGGGARNTEQTDSLAISYDQSVHPDTLRIPVGSGDIWQGVNDSANMLLRTLPDNWTSLRLKIAAFNPQLPHQGVGLIAYQDDDNYVIVNRVYSNGPEVELYHELAGTATIISRLPLTNTGNLLLRLDRNPQTNVHTAFYSTNNGNNWNALPSSVTQVLTSPRVGILVGGNGASTILLADLAFVEILTQAGDTDGDGLSDTWEQQFFGDLTHSGTEDFDNDGLTNTQEFTANTNPTTADTDGDGFSDGMEVASGSDPRNPNSIPTFTLAANPTSLSFNAILGGVPPASQSLTITSTGSLSWSATATQPWLTVSPTAAGTTPSTVTVTANPAGLAEGTYNATITVTAQGASNSPQTVPVTFVILPPGPTGLVAAYSFSEGSGPSVDDASSNSNLGTIAGATWTASGRYGGALSFDGTNDAVTVPDASALDLGSRGTMEAWVRLTAVNRWHSVIAKGSANSDAAHNYGLEITNTNVARCILGNGAAFQVLDSSSPVVANQFYHLACTWDGTTVRLYVNGTLNQSAAQALTPAGNTASLFIGKFGGNADWLRGIIDEVRIYNRDLLAGEIQADMDTPIALSGPTAPIADFSAAPTAGSSPLAVTFTDTSIGSVTAWTWDFGDGGNSTLQNPTHTYTATGTYTVNLTVSSSNGSDSEIKTNYITVSDANPTGLGAAYSFSEGSGPSVDDASSNSNLGTIAGATWTASGRYGGALSFDGTNDAVTVPDASALDLGSRGTMEAWVRLTAVNRWHSVIAKGSANSDAAHNYGLEITNTNVARCILGNGAAFQVLDSSSPVVANQFYHLACTWDGTTVRLYVNGTLNQSAAQALTPAGNTASLFIGKFGGNADWLRGIIDEVRIYNRDLSASAISTDMNTPIP